MRVPIWEIDDDNLLWFTCTRTRKIPFHWDLFSAHVWLPSISQTLGEPPPSANEKAANIRNWYVIDYFFKQQYRTRCRTSPISSTPGDTVCVLTISRQPVLRRNNEVIVGNTTTVDENENCLCEILHQVIQGVVGDTRGGSETSEGRQWDKLISCRSMR